MMKLSKSDYVIDDLAFKYYVFSEVGYKIQNDIFCI